MYIGIAVGASVCIALFIAMFCIQQCNKNREEALLQEAQQVQEAQSPDQQV